jgi:hypothetical protein
LERVRIGRGKCLLFTDLLIASIDAHKRPALRLDQNLSNTRADRVSATELDLSLREIERLAGGPESGGGAMLNVDSLAACLATLPLHERLGMPALALWGLVRAQTARLNFCI